MHSSVKLRLITGLVNPKLSMTRIDLYTQRRALRLTQKELASKLGVCRQTINVWERGHRRIPYWCDLTFIVSIKPRGRGPYEQCLP
jgi:DNA-binding XRE family transcriptional regulator